MSVKLVIQGKTLEILQAEANFFHANPTALARAIIDRVVRGGSIRDVLQGVDVHSYEIRRRGRPRSARSQKGRA